MEASTVDRPGFELSGGTGLMSGGRALGKGGPLLPGVGDGAFEFADDLAGLIGARFFADRQGELPCSLEAGFGLGKSSDLFGFFPTGGDEAREAGFGLLAFESDLREGRGEMVKILEGSL